MGLYSNVACTQLPQDPKQLEAGATTCLKLNDTVGVAIKPIVRAYCNEYNLEYSPAAYASFIRRLPKDWVTITDYTHSSSCRECWKNDIQELEHELRLWATVYYVESPIPVHPGYYSFSETIRIWRTDIKPICRWMRDHMDQTSFFLGRYYISRKAVERIRDDWSNVLLARDVVADFLKDYPASAKPILKHAIKDALGERPPACLIPAGTFPHERPGIHYLRSSDLPLFEQWLLDETMDIPAWPYTCLERITHLDRDRVRKYLRTTVIESLTPDYLITTREIRRIEALASQYTPVDDIVEAIVMSVGSEFDISNTKDRNQFIMRASRNGWWNLDVQIDNEVPLFAGKLRFLVNNEDVEDLSEHIRLWLSCYQKPYDDQIRIVLDAYAKSLPHTIQDLRAYVCMLPSVGQAHVDMVDALLDILPCDLIELEPERRISILEILAPYTTIVARKELAKFYKAKGYIDGDIKVAPSGRKQNTSAYPIWDFATMAFAMIGKEEVARLGLVSKAANNRKFADLWLYTVLHLFASWRTTDLTLLSPPKLPYAPEVVLEKVRSGTYSVHEARSVANRFIAYEEDLWRYPQKTKKYHGVDRLYFFCPENCRDIFGLILSIAAAHYELDPTASTFVNPVRSRKTIFQFYGSEFVEACGYRNFSGRRANKSLMQAIEWEANEEGQLCPLVAYSMAALMRSHKREYGALAHMTATYIGDGAYSGYSKEFIFLQQMLRGSCSFHIDHMLRTLYGEKYTDLPLVLRTEAIQRVGIPHKYIDNALKHVQKAMSSAEQSIDEIFSTPDDMRHALIALACGKGHGKDMHTQCLCKAADMQCKYPSRLSCLGCRYEIKSQAMIMKLSHVCKQLMEEQKQDGIIGKRATFMLENSIFPTLAEIYVHIEESPEGKCSSLFSLFPQMLLSEASDSSYTHDTYTRD